VNLDNLTGNHAITCPFFRCGKCGKQLVIRSRSDYSFLGCISFPACRFTIEIVEAVSNYTNPDHLTDDEYIVRYLEAHLFMSKILQPHRFKSLLIKTSGILSKYADMTPAKPRKKLKENSTTGILLIENSENGEQ